MLAAIPPYWKSLRILLNSLGCGGW
jgi:hypothetical protein